MVEAVEDPGEERMHLEEDTLLAQAVELGIAVEKAGGDELVKNSHYERGEDSEEDIVEGKSPGLKDHFAGEGVLECILSSLSWLSYWSDMEGRLTQNWVM